MNVPPLSTWHLVRARFFDFAGADFANSAADAVDSFHHQHRNAQYYGVVLLALNVSYWLQADLQSPEIDFRYAPNNGHSQRDLYGISAQPRPLLGQLLALITRPDMTIVLLDHPD